MTASVGQTFPGVSPGRSYADPTVGGDKAAASGFGELVHGVGRAHGRNPAQDAERQQKPAHLAPVRGRDAGPVEGRDKATPADGEGDASSSGARPGRHKPAHDAAIADDRSRGESATALQDKLPLLIALHDLRRLASPASSGAGAGTGDTPDNAASEARAGAVMAGEPLVQGGKTARSAGAATRPVATAPGDAEDAPLSAAGRSEKQMAFGSASLAKAGMDDAAAASSLSEPSVPGTPVSAARQGRSGPGARRMDRDEPVSRTPGPKAFSPGGQATVVAAQSFPAPAQYPVGQTASALAGAIASDGTLQQALSAQSAPGAAPPVAIATHMLRIELHPAELGMVSAGLRLAGGQLSVEIRPETHEAYRRLSSDSDDIVKSLRGLGLDVDKVTVLQPAVAPSGATRAESAGSAGRDQPSFQPGGSNGNGGGEAGRHSGRNHGNDAQDAGRAAPPSRERADGDLFI